MRVYVRVIGHLSVIWPGLLCACSGPALGHTPVLLALCTAGTGACLVGGQGGPCMSSISSPCCAALHPQGKFWTLIAVSNQTALCTGTDPWPRGRGRAQTSPFCCIPLCPFLSPSPLGHRTLYIGPSAFPHWALDSSIDLSLAVPGPGVGTSQEEKREAGSPLAPQAARGYASLSYRVSTLSTYPWEGVRLPQVWPPSDSL